MRSVTDGRLEVYKPDNDTDTPDFTVPKEDVQSVDASLRAGKLKDEGQIILSNDDGSYSVDNEVTSGDRLKFWVSLDTYIREWGEQAWGDGAWGGELDRWTCMVRDVDLHFVSPDISDMEISAEGFVGAVADKRRVYNVFRNTQMTGSSDSVLTTVLENEAPEIGQQYVDTVTSTTTLSSDGKKLLEVIQILADRSDAIIASRQEELIFSVIDNLSSQFEVPGDEIGALTNKISDTGVVNEVRVDGGTAVAVDQSQTTQSSYTTVTNSTRATFQVTHRKAEMPEIEIWTKTTGSNEAITVRLQKDDGGAPVAIGDTSSDIVNKTLDHNFLDDDGFTTFQFRGHTLPEPNPWVIIETDGSVGQDIGTDGSGNVAYKAKYGYEITIRESNASSIESYRKREGRIKADAVETPEEGHDVALEKIDHDSVPEQTVEFEADSDRTHHLSPTDIVTLNFDREKVSGDHIVIERNDTYDGVLLETTLVVQEVSTV